MNAKPSDRSNKQITTSQSGESELIESLKPYLKTGTEPEAISTVRRYTFQHKLHIGPIPPAEELEHLERIHPGLADRCMNMAEKEQAHRLSLDSAILSKEFTLKSTGQWLALAALALLVTVTAYLAYLGFGKESAYLGVGTIVGVVAIFVTGRHLESRALEADREEAPKPEKSRTNVARPKR